MSLILDIFNLLNIRWLNLIHLYHTFIRLIVTNINFSLLLISMELFTYIMEDYNAYFCHVLLFLAHLLECPCNLINQVHALKNERISVHSQ